MAVRCRAIRYLTSASSLTRSNVASPRFHTSFFPSHMLDLAPSKGSFALFRFWSNGEIQRCPNSHPPHVDRFLCPAPVVSGSYGQIRRPRLLVVLRQILVYHLPLSDRTARLSVPKIPVVHHTFVRQCPFVNHFPFSGRRARLGIPKALVDLFTFVRRTLLLGSKYLIDASRKGARIVTKTTLNVS